MAYFLLAGKGHRLNVTVLRQKSPRPISAINNDWSLIYRERGQPRSQGPLSTSRKYPGCGWSRVYVYKSNPHRGWIIDLILSTLSESCAAVIS